MSIHVTCPNGHALKVKDEFAGRTGKCPKCRALVVVPAPDTDDLSDDDILGMIDDGANPGVDPGASSIHHAGDTAVHSGDSSLASASSSSITRRWKKCRRCKAEVPVSYHHCPHCNTYFGDTVGRSTAVVIKCANCGSDNLPGEIFCTACGNDLLNS